MLGSFDMKELVFNKKVTTAVLGIMVSASILFFQGRPDGLLHLYFLNVGQGDAIFLRTPAGTTILVDGGPEKKVLDELGAVLPFFAKTIDYVFLTHPDRDHIEGLLSVLRRYRIGQVIFTGTLSENFLSRRFLEIIREKNIPVRLARADNDIALPDGIKLDILFPLEFEIQTTEKTNNTSIIMKIIYGEHEILLTGDAEAAEEEILLAHGVDLAADMLKVAHHGSKTSSTENFLRAVSPKSCVILVGRYNSYHHPHPSILKRLSQHCREIFRTDTNGRLEFIFDHDRVISAPRLRNFSSKRS